MASLKLEGRHKSYDPGKARVRKRFPCRITTVAWQRRKEDGATAKMQQNGLTRHSPLTKTPEPCVCYSVLLGRHTAHAQDFPLLHWTHSVLSQRDHSYGSTFSGQEFHFVGSAVSIDMDYDSYITWRQTVLREVICQHDGIQFLNHVFTSGRQ